MVWKGDLIMNTYMMIIYSENKRAIRVFFKTDNLFLSVRKYHLKTTHSMEVYKYNKGIKDYVYIFTIFFDRGLSYV